ncbi:FG-GAP-like repeat-containing protein [Kitasatospora sp. NPDC006697]|uniref:FG-GAP-like repeat-containing protein n=1 Tax=Kitasatospora sp. NPDC006697 TaxID=3364020 RepID=UPI00369AE31F
MDHVHPRAPRRGTGRRRRSGLALLTSALLACAAGLVGPTGATAAPVTVGAASPSSAAAPQDTLFDDFHYTDQNDPALAAHGWTIRQGGGGPAPMTPSGQSLPVSWSKDAVSFSYDTLAGSQVMQLRATNNGTSAVQAQISTTQRKFYSGTYAARVYFNDYPTSDNAGGRPVEAFYAIAPENPLRPDLYSELDNEYLPNGGWPVTDSNSSLWNTAWYHVEDDNHKVDKASFDNGAASHLQGWHTLEMTVANNAVAFYLDGTKYFTPASAYYPREAMTIDFNEWFNALDPGQNSVWDEKVGWVYYTDSGALSPTAVDSNVAALRTAGTHFVDTVPNRPPTHDYNGDGLGDVSLVSDYGPSDPAKCPQGGTRHTTMFDLAGQPDPAAPLTPTPQWDGLCEAGAPKLTTSGDFNGDGRADVAALYDYGPTDPSCPHSDHMAIREWLATGTGSLQNPTTVWDSPCFGGGTTHLNAGDFNGDGKSDLALLYDYGGGDLKLLTLTADSNGDGGFGGLVTQWAGKALGTTVGSSTKFMTTGDFNGDGRSDLALFTDCGDTSTADCPADAHQAVFTFTADPAGTGTLRPPVRSWQSPGFGSGTKFVSAGDFNGDGKSDLALLYDYGAGHEAVITLTADQNGGFGGLVPRWDGTSLGVAPTFMTTGDYNDDGKSDLALFEDYGNTGATCANGHRSLYTLTADPYGTGGLQAPVQVWNHTCWGPGTTSVN